MSGTRRLFAAAIFLGSFLLFLVEPIAAKQLLPILGGSAAVWITCLVFFQTALLAAYLYAHWLARRPRWVLHFAVLALAACAAIAWAARSSDAFRSGADHPIATVFVALSAWIGLPFLALGATSPLLQVWWAKIEAGGIPYRLFALSNLASMLALGLYPSWIEPAFSLQAQRISWACGFGLFALLSAVLAVKARGAQIVPSAGDDANEQEAPPAPLSHKVMWVLLPMGGAMQLSAVTSYLTANVAPIPLLWILPLGVYLLTIILAFEWSRFLPRSIVSRLLIVMLAGVGYALTKQDTTWPMRISIGFFLLEAFAACLFCHSETYALKPKRNSESTLFYLLFAAGGAAGSFLIGIAFPLLFRFNFDLVITCCMTAILAFATTWKDGWSQRLLWGVASIALAVQIHWIHTVLERNTIAATRNFYGALRVKQSFGIPGATLRTLANGSVEHGTQIFGTDEQRKTPTSYYAPDSGVGLALRLCCDESPRKIGVIGLGAGTLAAYGRRGDQIEFYDINPGVEPIARNVFTYLRESAASVHVISGDARTSLAQEPPQGFDVLAIDAFSGDAIPLHLLTKQALALFLSHLKPGGVLAFHISNRHVDLAPPIALLAQDAGLHAVTITTGAKEARGEFTATWMLLTMNGDLLKQPEIARVAHRPQTMPGLRLWTDDYSSLLPVLEW
jgi:spermidine synthase